MARPATFSDWRHLIDEMAFLRMNSLAIGVYGCWVVQYEGKRTEFLMVPFPDHPRLQTPKTIRWWSPAKQGYQNNAAAVAGSKVFAVSGCTTCHTYLGVGSSNLGAPNLSAEGAKHKGVAFQIAHLKCPSCVNKGSPMPVFSSLGDANLRKLAAFLEASKGPK